MTAPPPGRGTRLPFGLLLRTLRIRAALSQELLAERAGISADTIGALERGRRKAPQRETLALIIAALGLPVADRTQLERAALASRPPARLGPEIGPQPLEPSAPGSTLAPMRVPHNLPHATNSFHGRDRQLSDLSKLLEDRRIITLLGTGGVGKTRLALEFGRHEIQHARFRDGIWVVDLAIVERPELVVASFASALGISETPDHTLLAMLETHLRERELLVIVDSCEHVLDAAAAVIERLLRSCRNVRFLTTSREALNIDGELRVHVEPLGLCEPANIEWVRRSPAAQLFIARATDVQPALYPDAALADPGVVAAICQRLDGLPLGLELAAARVHELSLRQIQAGLENRFALLTRGRRLAQPRQQTLLGCISWSYELLDEVERIVLRRLGIFPADWTLEAALSVCGPAAADETFTTESALDGLAALVTKSLVTVERLDSDAVRYRFLESVRYFARGLLHANGESGALAARHARYCKTWVDRAVTVQRRGTSSHAALHLVAASFYDLHAALDWALGERNDVSLGADIVAALAHIWSASGDDDEQTGSASDAPAGFGIAGILALCTAPAHDAPPAPEDRAGLARRLRQLGAAERTYRAGEHIFRKGDIANELFLIVAGTVLLEEFGATIGAGDLLGEVAFFLPTKRRTATARCETAVRVLAVDERLMPGAFERDPLLRAHVLHVFAKRIMQDIKRVDTAGIWR